MLRLVLICFALVPVFTYATDYEITLQPNPVWGEDAAVDSREPTANFGDDEELWLDYDGSDVSRFYVYFETDFLEDLDLTAAVFSLYATSVSGGDGLDVEVYGVTENWHENTITWDDQPAVGSLLGSAAFPVDTGWFDVSLPVPPYDEGLMVTVSDESEDATAVFRSSDSTAEYERPKLTLTFEFSRILPVSLGRIKTMFR
jgi:hypothetical protein